LRVYGFYLREDIARKFGVIVTKRIDESDQKAIEDVLRRHPDGATARQLAAVLRVELPQRTLQYRLKQLVKVGLLVKHGKGRGTRYRLPPMEAEVHEAITLGTLFAGEVSVPLSARGAEVRTYVRQPIGARKPVGYNRDFLHSYRPNESFYLLPVERARLREVGRPAIASQPAGTYARQLLSRLLIDLSWNSSRLEGNTYSLLDTRRLIELGEAAEGATRLEAQMILNHKEAIEFLVGAADEIGFNRHTILNLHALLANNLLSATVTGKLRHIPVGIAESVFYPLEVPQLIDECFDQILATAEAIEDPFEQAFFVMVQLPYLQPFDDVNKRVSRLAANIPFIKGNLVPLSFIDVPRSTYTDAILGVYELNSVDLLRDVFIWAYERSSARYAAVRQSLGEPDPFRLQHRDALRQIVGEVIRGCMNMKAAAAHIAAWVEKNIEPDERARFRETAETELLSLHEGNFARYRVRPAEFAAWYHLWAGKSGKAK
jgi:DNA-binding transcriptional ArsR family regulator